MSVGRTVYNALFRRTSTFAVTIFVGAFAFERIFDVGMDNLWGTLNRGVSLHNIVFYKCFSLSLIKREFIYKVGK